MTSQLNRFSKILFVVFLFLFTFNRFAQADSVLILHASYGNAETNIGSRLVAEGHSVTYSTGGVPSSVSGYQQIWDLRYNNAYSASEITVLDNFVKNGGFLMMNGENANFASRNNSIASVISTLGGGTLTFGSSYTSSFTIINSKFTNDTGTVTGAAGSALINSKGQWVFKDTSGNIGGMIWQAADLGSGYTGAVFVTADINMWDSTYGSTLLKVYILDDIIDMETAGTLYGAVAASVTITGSQITAKSTAQNTVGSGIYIDQVGDNLDLTVSQHGANNLVIGKNWSSHAGITGDDNTVNIQQGTALHPSDNNAVGFSINGDNNSVDIRQDSLGFGGGGHRARLDLSGNLNSVTMMQDNDGSGAHYMDITISGSQNTVTAQQQNNISKDTFAVITGNSNTVNTMQKDSGSHYLDINLSGNGHSVTTVQEGSGNHSARIDLTNQGGSSSVNLNQKGSTSQTYSLSQQCTNVLGCTTTLTQQ